MDDRLVSWMANLKFVSLGALLGAYAYKLIPSSPMYELALLLICQTGVFVAGLCEESLRRKKP